MLSSLHIKNVAVIDETDAVFGGGFNVLTGETGAGKSIVIDSINMILGERATRELVRHGEKKALVQAVFSVSSPKVLDTVCSMGFEAEDGELLLSREISADGRSTCRIGSQLATSSSLRELGRYLLNIHGQHDNQFLLSTAHHIEFLDGFAGEECLECRKAYREQYERYTSLKATIASLETDETEKNRQIDLLRYQIEEIEKAALQPGEEEQLSERHKVASNAEKILESLSEAYSILYDGEVTVYDGLSSVSKLVSGVGDCDSALAKTGEDLSDILYQVSDIASQLRAFRDSLDFDPFYLQQLEQRQQEIFSLKRKYGGSIEEILSYLEQMKRELSHLESAEEDLALLQTQLSEVRDSLTRTAAKLSSLRHTAASRLCSLVEAELSDLDMQKTQFSVQMESEEEFHANGCDRVEFLISTNPGEPLKALSKIASGGELSRIMLALKSVLAESDAVETLIFDEIDTGVSGRAAQKIALKLCQIARHKQVICITHLAQIASMADHHYLIEKDTTHSSSSTHIRLLEDDMRCDELSRMIGGLSITETAKRHATEMLALARETKEKISCSK